ncbi:MAG TPA: glycosyltransferase [Pyrinomonadaceae bacterium]|nr:glycosyltransferase [Pyrinomonadaceae bacterium]
MIFCDYYLPGFKGGGGMWSVVNLVDRFKAKYDFFIVTRDRDLAETTPYKNVASGEWNKVVNAEVFYFKKGELTAKRVAELVAEIKPEAVYLNSTFSLPVRRFLSARRKKLIAKVPVILAPCGEMSKAALAIKAVKKALFLKYATKVGLYNGVIWKASFDTDAVDIRDVFGAKVEVMTAPDLVPESILPDYAPSWKPEKKPGSVKFVYLSRISPKKNLAYLLERLKNVRDGAVSLEIIGPVDDEAYWQRCEALIKDLPKNIAVNALGAFPNLEALRLVAKSHFFVMPTLNENFGYVFIEALAAGCPILISDNTVWTDIDERNAGWQIPLDKPESFVEKINSCIAMDAQVYSQMSDSARRYAAEWLDRTEINEATALVLTRAIEGKCSRTDAR